MPFVEVGVGIDKARPDLTSGQINAGELFEVFGGGRPIADALDLSLVDFEVAGDEAVVIGPIGAGVRQEALGDFAVEEPVVVGEHGAICGGGVGGGRTGPIVTVSPKPRRLPTGED
jgi:hypothetical protein